jgi:hypothetical protein
MKPNLIITTVRGFLKLQIIDFEMLVVADK